MKKRKHVRYIFPIIILLTICSVWILFNDSKLSIFQKTIYVCLNLTYLFLIAEYIEMIIFSNILISKFEFKLYFPFMKYYQIYNIVLPIISILIYVLAWVFYLSESGSDIKIFGILILISESFLSYSFFGRNRMVFANKNTIATFNCLISYDSISTYDLKTIKRMGVTINEVTVKLYNGDVIIFNIINKYLDELIENLSK
ncbi:MAG: hypothetical protein GX271_01720 [Clostridiales bacterium]|nr:hypothetical protein [Clostridiales bacterium]